MKILAVSDMESKSLWDYYQPGMLDDIGLILSAGDLDSSYLSFLVTMAHCPLLYVHGNHDTNYPKRPPEGCICIEDKIYVHDGIRILGLGGSMKYNQGLYQYTEKEMSRRLFRLTFPLLYHKSFDILLTHAPVRGIGDQEDLCHRGFECFGPLLDKYRPAVMIHGHVHQAYSAFFQRQRDYHGIPVINASTSYVFDLPDTPDRKEPTRRGLRIMEKASRFE